MPLPQSGEAISLDCQCRGDLALRHKACAIKWSRVKGDAVCDICKSQVNFCSPGSLRCRCIGAKAFGRQCVMGDLSMACWLSMLSHPGRPSLYAVFSPLSSVVTHPPVSDSCPALQVANLPTPPPRASSPSGSDADITIEEYAAHGGAPCSRTVTNSTRVIILFSFAVPLPTPAHHIVGQL